ncbi:N-acetyltransferase [Primorskyibacter flagellatus]|uniref:N-acetyltransferase n=1 Tax=Primorskyibacter flagellatus TaxID=1387277 RepID=A0A917EBQ9_9RHOB|nr:N-acetyltransferase [Primorskyibacter flagellatus]GGE17726.1 N-acetyltransferase [Primorskyibacter flagellatus]
MNLRPFAPQDATAVSVLLNTAFDGSSESQLVASLREAGDMALELVAEDETSIYGYIAFCRLREPEGWWSLSPVAVSPRRQNERIGSDLINYGLDFARQAGARAITVLGSPDYYRRFGFNHKAAENLTIPYARDYFMLYPIAPGTAGAAATVSYPQAFSAL